MTRATETQHKQLQWHVENGKRRYLISWGGFRDSVIKVHRLYVPGVDDDAVVVTGIWRETENHLLQPTTLLYLNRLQQWFDWATMWGTRIELASDRALTMEITVKLDKPYLNDQLDHAYRAWAKKYPNGSAESWGAYAMNHVKDGLVECAMSRCENTVVPGTTCCAEHQKLA